MTVQVETLLHIKHISPDHSNTFVWKPLSLQSCYVATSLRFSNLKIHLAKLRSKVFMIVISIMWPIIITAVSCLQKPQKKSNKKKKEVAADNEAGMYAPAVFFSLKEEPSVQH